MSANVQTMMYTGEVPWHGLGKKLEREATSEEAIIAAGLNWTVSKKPVFAQTLHGNVMLPNNFATVREDNQQVLGIVGTQFEVLQNKDAFRFCDALVGEAAAMYHTAGALGDGEIIWILAKLPKTIRLKNQDDIENYLLFSHRHDGRQRVRVMFTPIRVVCQNTLNMAASENKNIAYIRHVAGMGGKLQNVREQLGILYNQMDLFEELSNKMAEKQINRKIFQDYLASLKLAVEAEDLEKEKVASRKMEVEDMLTSLFEFGPGAFYNSSKGTVWGAYNAVTRYVDFERGYYANKDNATHSKSILFGSGSDLKQRAWNQAVELIK